jgi:hypothetical protein
MKIRDEQMKNIVGLLLSTLAFSVVAQNTGENQPTGLTKVVQITNFPGISSNLASENLSVFTSQTTQTNPANCPNTRPYVLPETSEISKAMILTAVASNADVQFIIYGAGCINDRPQIVAVQLFNQQ